MDYIALLSTTARLLDLHDSQRAYGGISAYGEEKRAGHTDGIYLDIAVEVIAQLYALDQTSSHDYLPFNTILKSIRSGRQDVLEEDVHYVLNVMRRPTELWYLGKGSDSESKSLMSEKRRTALIEKTDYADEYRLSVTGRAFVSLSQVAKDASYIRGDAYNLLHAIDFGEFGKMEQFAEEIIRQLRDEILNVRSALEKIGKTETYQKYIDNFDRYGKVIKDTLDIIGRSEREFSSPETLDWFNCWQENNNADLTYESLSGLLTRIRQTLEVFNRVIQDLVSSTLKGSRTSVKPPSFLSLALEQVRRPERQETIDFLVGQWGALGLAVHFHSPLDGYGAVRVRTAPVASTNLVFDNNDVEPVSRVGKLEFMDRHGKAISDALRKAPLRLSDAIEQGWFQVNDRTMLGDLVGVFVAPESLELSNEIQISLLDKMNIADVKTGHFFYTDLEISILNKAAS